MIELNTKIKYYYTGLTLCNIASNIKLHNLYTCSQHTSAVTYDQFNSSYYCTEVIDLLLIKCKKLSCILYSYTIPRFKKSIQLSNPKQIKCNLTHTQYK